MGMMQPQVVVMNNQQQNQPAFYPKGEGKQRGICRYCHNMIETDNYKDESGNCVFFWVMFILGFFTGFTWFISCCPWCGCGCDMNKWVHKCPNCNRQLSTWAKSE